jgi:hypothetical protein
VPGGKTCGLEGYALSRYSAILYESVTGVLVDSSRMEGEV